MSLTTLPTKKVFGFSIVNCRYTAWLDFLTDYLFLPPGNKSSTLISIMTPNPEQIMLAKSRTSFAALLYQADYLIPDGTGLVWAGRLKARLTGLDTTVALLRLAQTHQLKVLLIGGRYGQAEQLKINYGDVQTKIFYTPGYQNIAQPTQIEEKTVERLIASLKPDIILLAFGAPAQEQWLVDHRQLLAGAKVRLALVVGGTFDVLLGKIARAPASWQRAHLEWLWRLRQEPHRLKRQLVLLPFIWFAWRERLRLARH